MLYPDWTKLKVIVDSYNTSGSYTIKENGYIIAIAHAKFAAAYTYLNGITIACTRTADGDLRKFDYNSIIVKIGDVISYDGYLIPHELYSSSYATTIYFMPYKR